MQQELGKDSDMRHCNLFNSVYDMGKNMQQTHVTLHVVAAYACNFYVQTKIPFTVNLNCFLLMRTETTKADEDIETKCNYNYPFINKIII